MLIKLAPEDLISSVREGLNTTLKEGMTWNIISCDWYERWKLHVNFDNQSEPQGNPPGEITNADLVTQEGSTGTLGIPLQLCESNVEGLDFFALPSKNYNHLKAAYGSDIDIERQVILVGGNDNSAGVAQIEINPICVKVYVVKSKADGTDLSLKYLPPSAVLHISRLQTLASVVEIIRSKLLLDPPPLYSEDMAQTPIRFWAKTSTTAHCSNEEHDHSTTPTSYTKDHTDFCGDYMFLRDLGTSASDYDDMLLENAVNMTKKRLDLVVEVGSSSSASLGTISWPRDQQLHQWTDSLRTGDLLEAFDNYGTWREALVVAVHTSSVELHYKGWADKFDETIRREEFMSRVSPLYTRTSDWRGALQVGSELDYTRVVSKGGSKWFPGIVTEVNRDSDTVSVKFKQQNEIVLAETGIPLDSEQICCKGTHVSKDQDWNFNNVVPHPSVPSAAAVPRASTVAMAAAPHDHHSYRGSVGHRVGTPLVRGAVGLANLGNTCFMNSTLQCLSNTPGLTQLFREDRHVDQVNYDNVLGHKGQLANVYAKLIKDMWSDLYTSVRPDEFKRNIGEFAPQFSGYQQHDSSELMMFLLDGLHEDMNRVQKKPAVEKIESKGRCDDLISAESWRRYLLRNDSELVDLCFGQLKSHVTCVSCGHSSVTFDEYSSLSLPVAVKMSREFSLIVYPLPVGSRPFRASVSARKDAPVSELLALVAEHPLFKRAAESRKHSELGKRKKDNDASYLLVDADTLDTVTQQDVSAQQLDGSGPLKSSSCSDIETLGNISIETDLEESAVLVSSARTTAETLPSADDKGPFFHMCSLSTGYDNTRVQKTHDASASIHDADSLMVVYEMAHEVPTNNYTAHRYTSSFHVRIPSAPEEEYTFFDLLVGVKKVSPYSTSYARDSGFNTAGHPLRIAYEKGVTTREKMNGIIFEAMRVAYDLPEAFSSERLPYTIHTTSSFAHSSKNVVDLMDNKKDDSFALSSYDCLLCCWNDDALRGDDDSSSVGSFACDTEEDADGVTVAAVELKETEEGCDVAISPVDPLQVTRWLEDGINGTCTGKKSNTGRDDTNTQCGMDIMRCFDKFTEREQMPPEETWYCPKCKQHLAPIKKFDIWSAPEILVVHLKRFQYSSRASFTYREKVNDLINFPVEGLDLSDVVKSSLSANASTPAVYDLYGVSEHSGTMGGGHYTAKCKNQLDGKWYSFNDSFVQECTPESSISREAYVLFYKRRHGHLKWGGLVPSPVPLDN